MLTLAWDVDDVLNDLMRTWLEAWWRPRHRGHTLKYEDITENPPHRLLGIELEEYLQSLDQFRLSGCYEQMQPNPQVLGWFEKDGSAFRHIAVTCVPRVAGPISASWVIGHFGDWIRALHFVPSARRDQPVPPYDATKADCLKRLNQVDIFIDDGEHNLMGLTKTGIRYFLVSRPWNTSTLRMQDLLRTLSGLRRGSQVLSRST